MRRGSYVQVHANHRSLGSRTDGGGAVARGSHYRLPGQGSVEAIAEAQRLFAEGAFDPIVDRFFAPDSTNMDQPDMLSS